MSDPTQSADGRARRPFGWRLPLHVVRALWLLAWARVVFSCLPLSRLLAMPGSADDGASAPRHAVLVDVVSRVVPEIADRVPWRADCLIQALAAQRWLASQGVPSQIEIGVNPAAPDGFASHAWLRCGGRIVTGQTESPFPLFLGGDPQ